MPARAAAARTTSHSTFADMPFPQTWPALLIARNTRPCVMPAAAVHASTWFFTRRGRTLEEPPALLGCKPVPESDADPPHPRHSTNTGRQFGTQKTGVCCLVRDAPKRRPTED